MRLGKLFAGKGILVAAAVLIAVVLGNGAAFFYQQYLFFNVYGSLDIPSPFMPVRFIIYGSSDETISAKFFLLDAAGREFATFERSWAGGSLFIECSAVEIGGRKISFPYQIFTESARLNNSRRGTNLARYYMDSGVCALYSRSGQDADEQKAFYRLARFTLKERFFPGLEGPRSRTVIALAECERGVLYSLLFDSAGNYYLISDTK